jgi:predicted flap endonuclease-1-like 5' DNA nuclease
MGAFLDIAEIAVLIAIAYSAGWAVGYFGRGLTQSKPAALAPPPARLAAVTGELASEDVPDVAAASLAVTNVAPVVDSYVPPPAPVIAAAMDPMSSVAASSAASTPEVAPPVPSTTPAPAIAAAEIEPSFAIEASPIPVEPVVTATPQLSPVAAAEVAARPPVQPLSTADDEDEFVVIGRPVASRREPRDATPTSQPGVAWGGDVNGHAAPAHGDLTGAEPAKAATPPPASDSIFEPPLMVQPDSELIPAFEPASVPPAASDIFAPASAEDREIELPPVVLAGRKPTAAVVDPSAMLAAMLAEAPVVLGDPASDDQPAVDPEPPGAPVPETLIVPPPEPVIDLAPAVATSAAPAAEDDAMRAIEGGWSRRRVRAAAMTPEIELDDVSAAVSAAQNAVRQVLAESETKGTPGSRMADSPVKPLGLPRPRDGRRDDLKEIGGLGPLDESTLNNIGIFHFEQVAEWTAMEVLWLENHVFARGRIGREQWQGRARELAAGRPARVAKP